MIKRKLRFLLNTNLHQDSLSLNIYLYSIFGTLSYSQSLSHTHTDSHAFHTSPITP